MYKKWKVKKLVVFRIRKRTVLLFLEPDLDLELPNPKILFITLSAAYNFSEMIMLLYRYLHKYVLGILLTLCYYKYSFTDKKNIFSKKR